MHISLLKISRVRHPGEGDKGKGKRKRERETEYGIMRRTLAHLRSPVVWVQYTNLGVAGGKVWEMNGTCAEIEQ